MVVRFVVIDSVLQDLNLVERIVVVIHQYQVIDLHPEHLMIELVPLVVQIVRLMRQYLNLLIFVSLIDFERLVMLVDNFVGLKLLMLVL